MNTVWDEPNPANGVEHPERPMNIMASGEVRAFVRERGGQLFVWTTDHRCCRGTLTLLEVSTTRPTRARETTYERVDAGGFALYFDAGGRRHPRELVLELKGRRRALRAYWNNCAYII